MNRALIVSIVFLAVLGLSTTAFAQERVIKLKDGSVIKGVVVAKNGDVYKIKSPVFGFLSVREADVSSIEDPQLAAAAAKATSEAPKAQPAPVVSPVPSGQSSASSPATPVPPMSGDYRGYQEKIMSSPESMSAIQALTQDKEMMEIVNDPKLRAAIFSGNIEYLKNNEKFLKFVNSPAVKTITESALGPEQGAKNGGQDKNQSGK